MEEQRRTAPAAPTTVSDEQISQMDRPCLDKFACQWRDNYRDLYERYADLQSANADLQSQFQRALKDKANTDAENKRLSAENRELRAQNKTLQDDNEQKEIHNSHLEEQNADMRAEKYGTSSEKRRFSGSSDKDSQEQTGEETGEGEENDALKGAPADTKSELRPDRPAKGQIRKWKPKKSEGSAEEQRKHLPVVEEEVPADPEIRDQWFAGTVPENIHFYRSYYTDEVVTVESFSYTRRRWFLSYYDDKTDKPVNVLTMCPWKRSPFNGMRTPELLTWIVIRKFVLQLPYYRITKELHSQGFMINAQTMANWVNVTVAGLLFPVVLRLWQLQMQQKYIQADETWLKVLKTSGLCYMWVFLTSDLCQADHRIVLYLFDERRSEAVLERYFGDHTDVTLLSDFWSAYSSFAKKHPEATSALCWQHLRSRVWKCLKTKSGFMDLPDEEKDKDPIWHNLFQPISKLFYEEKKMKEMEEIKTPEQRAEHRQKVMGPIMDEFFDNVDAYGDDLDRESFLGKAVTYARNGKEKFRECLNDGNIPISNNSSERCMLTISLARNSAKTIGSVRGANAMAYCESIIETAKANGADPGTYIRYLLETMPALMKSKEYKDVLEHADRNTDLSFLDSKLPWSEEFRAYEAQKKEERMQAIERMLSPFGTFHRPEEEETVSPGELTEEEIEAMIENELPEDAPEAG